MFSRVFFFLLIVGSLFGVQKKTDFNSVVMDVNGTDLLVVTIGEDKTAKAVFYPLDRMLDDWDECNTSAIIDAHDDFKATSTKRVLHCSDTRMVNNEAEILNIVYITHESLNIDKEQIEKMFDATFKKRDLTIKGDFGTVFQYLTTLDKKDDKGQQGLVQKSTQTVKKTSYYIEKIDVDTTPQKLLFSNIETNDGKKVDEKNDPLKIINTGKSDQVKFSIATPLTSIKEVEYDKDKDKLYEKETPTKFYFSFDIVPGDLLYDKRTFSDRFEIKLLFEASEHPSDSTGIGFGYDFGMCSIFAATVMVTEDGKENGVELKDEKRSWKTIYGLSFPLSKLAEWASE